MAEYIKQHYIPECYLKNFSNDGKWLHVYSKKPSKIFFQSISNIANKKSYYNIKNNRFPEVTGLENNTLERDFFASTFESYFNEILKKIIKNCDESSINTNNFILEKSEINIFSELIALQYIRLPQFRRKYWNLYKDYNTKTFDIIKSFLKYHNKIDNTDEEISFDDRFASDIHAGFLFDETFRYQIQEALVNKIWIFYYTEENVYTSDYPILLKPHLQNQKPFVESFAMRGVEVFFSISKNIILTMWDENVFHEKKEMHNKVFSLESKKLREYNLYQYCFAESQIYSEKNEFEIITIFKHLNNGDEYFSKSDKIKVY